MNWVKFPSSLSSTWPLPTSTKQRKPSTTLIYLPIRFCLGPEEIAEVRTSARRPPKKSMTSNWSAPVWPSVFIFLDAFPLRRRSLAGQFAPSLRQMSVCSHADTGMLCIACRQLVTSSYHQGETQAFDIAPPPHTQADYAYGWGEKKTESDVVIAPVPIATLELRYENLHPRN